MAKVGRANLVELSDVGRKRCWYKVSDVPPPIPFEHANNLNSKYQLLTVHKEHVANSLHYPLNI